MVRINKISTSGGLFYFLCYYQSNYNIFLTPFSVCFYTNNGSEYILSLKSSKKLNYIKEFR